MRQRNRAGKIYKDTIRKHNYKCAVCGWSVPYATPSGQSQPQGGCDIHHIVPVSKGGTDTEDNLILLCPNHHKEADTGFITVEELRKYTEKQTNILDWLKKQHKKRAHD